MTAEYCAVLTIACRIFRRRVVAVESVHCVDHKCVDHKLEQAIHVRLNQVHRAVPLARQQSSQVVINRGYTHRRGSAATGVPSMGTNAKTALFQAFLTPPPGCSQGSNFEPLLAAFRPLFRLARRWAEIGRPRNSAICCQPFKNADFGLGFAIGSPPHPTVCYAAEMLRLVFSSCAASTDLRLRTGISIISLVPLPLD